MYLNKVNSHLHLVGKGNQYFVVFPFHMTPVVVIKNNGMSMCMHDIFSIQYFYTIFFVEKRNSSKLTAQTNTHTHKN